MSGNRFILFLLFLSSHFLLAQSVEIVTQEKIQGVITHLSYSPDGRLIASGSAKENSIKVWDLQSGKIIGKLNGHEGPTTALCFSHDGTALISSAEDNRVILWDLINWQITDSSTTTSPINAFVRQPNSPGTFFSAAESGEVQQWQINQFRAPRLLYDQKQRLTAIDASNGHLISGSASGKTILFNYKSGTTVSEQKVHFGAIKGLRFFNNGQSLITAGAGGKIHIWTANSFEDSQTINASPIGINAFDAAVDHNLFVTVSTNNKIKVWQFDGTLLHAFKSHPTESKQSAPVKAIKISPDGTTLASSGFQRSPVSKNKADQNVIRIWDMQRGTLYQTLQGRVNPIYTFDFHPTENRLVTLGDDHKLTFWNFALAERSGDFQLPNPKREIAPPRTAVIKKGEKAKSIFDKIKTGDLGGLTDIDISKDKGKEVGAGMAKRLLKERPIVKFSSKGSYLITKLKKDEIRLYDLAETRPKAISPLFSYQFAVNQLLSSPDEKYLAVLGSGDSAVSIINLETQKFERKLSTPSPSGNLRLVYEATSLSFSPDGKYLAVCFNTGKTFVFSTNNWQQVFENELPENLGYVKTPFVNFSKDGKYMLVKTMLGITKYTTGSFNFFNSENLQVNGHSAPMDKPQDYAITVHDNHLYFEDIFTGDIQKSIPVSLDEITHISIHPEGLAGVTLQSGQFILLNPKTGKEDVLMVADGESYIFKTAQNFYKVSKEGYDLVTFRIGNEAFPFEQFDAIFNRPDLVLKTLGCTDDDLISLYEKAYQKRIKKLGLSPSSSVDLTDIPKTELVNAQDIPAITEEEEIAVKFTLSDQKALKTYNIWVNNVPIYGQNGKTISGKQQTIIEKVPLVYGLNKVQIACQNPQGFESLIQTLYVEKKGETPQRDLYLVTIGTSDYADSRYNLSYPVKDGQDFSELMNSNAKTLYRSVKTKALYNEDVTTTNVKALKAFLQQTRPDDVVLVFIAGHGVLDANFDYYFGTHSIDFNAPDKKGLPYEELEKLLDGIPANRKILIMDTCHSGEVDKDAILLAGDEDNTEEEDEDISFRAVGEAVKTDETEATPSKLAATLFNDLRKGTGATVISSAGGAEFAMESDEWKNGLFTYCMLNGLKNRSADLDNDGRIMLLELQAYVVDRVSQLSHGRQIPNSRIQNIELDFPLW